MNILAIAALIADELMLETLHTAFLDCGASTSDRRSNFDCRRCSPSSFLVGDFIVSTLYSIVGIWPLSLDAVLDFSRIGTKRHCSTGHLWIGRYS